MVRNAIGAPERWHELAKERNEWVADVFEKLVA